MRAITEAEIRQGEQEISNMSPAETIETMEQMAMEQPNLQVYLASVLAGRQGVAESDLDAFANLAGAIWQTMRKIGGQLELIAGEDILAREERQVAMYEYAAGEDEEDLPELVSTVMEGFEQLALVKYVVNQITDPESRWSISPASEGVMYTYLKVMIDSLNEAKPKEQNVND